MKLVLSRDEMRRMDMRTIKDFGIPSSILMETAGARSADCIRSLYPNESSGRILVLCGTGNNGGDGYVIARHLIAHCEELQILSPVAGRMSPEAAANRKLCEKLDIPIHEIQDPEALVSLMAFSDFRFDLIIDAIYGIGFRGELPAGVGQILTILDQYHAIKIAIDIPSGIDADTGQGYSMQMDATLAIAEPKYGHHLASGREKSGKLITIPIGIPPFYKEGFTAFIYDDLILPKRHQNSHKGDFGRVLLIGGSPGYLGSIKLAAQATLRAGSGLAYLYSRRENLSAYMADPDEIMVFGIPEVEGDLPRPDVDEMRKIINRADAIAIGCGMGLDGFALELLQIVLKYSRVPTVLDADALTLISQNPKLSAMLKKGRFLLTPHKQEFCRLAGIDLKTLAQDPIHHLTSCQRKVGCPILLKGHTSIYRDQEQMIFLTAGNDALATGGSGDVLCGIIASFAGQGLNLMHAACSASLLMGRTAERLSQSRSSFSILPSDIIEHIGDK